MSALIGIVVLALFCLALFVAIPFLLAPLVLIGMYLHRRRELAPETRAQQSPARAATVASSREEEREAARGIAQAA